MPTYLFSGSYDIFFSKFAEVLDAAGWTPAIPGGILPEKSAQAPARVDLLFVTVHEQPVPHMAKNTYTIRTAWQNLFDSDTKSAVDNKSNLHKRLAHTTIVVPTIPLADFVWRGREWIARPSGKGFHSGKGIKYIHDIRSWREALNYYGDTIDTNNVICSAVIVNPLLLNERKFHLRLYIFVYVSGTARITRVAPVGEIYTAKKPYISADWEDKLIHDSHWGTTDRPYVHPDDFPVVEYLPILDVQLRQFEIELRKLVGDFKPFANAAYAFELLAADVMLQASGYMRVLEVNSRIGMPTEETGSTERLAQWTARQFLEIYK
jgi:hypothetical protein